MHYLLWVFLQKIKHICGTNDFSFKMNLWLLITSLKKVVWQECLILLFFKHKTIVPCQLSFPHSYNLKMTHVSLTVFVHCLSLSVTVCILMHLHYWGIQFNGCFTLYIALARCLQYFSRWFSQEAQPWWWYNDKGTRPLHECFFQ